MPRHSATNYKPDKKGAPHTHANLMPDKLGAKIDKTVPDALKYFSSLPDDALVRQPVVEGLFACSATTVWRRVKKQLLPQPCRMGNITAWRVGDLRAVLRGNSHEK